MKDEVIRLIGRDVFDSIHRAGLLRYRRGSRSTLAADESIKNGLDEGQVRVSLVLPDLGGFQHLECRHAVSALSALIIAGFVRHL
jgi:hypothetical protein